MNPLLAIGLLIVVAGVFADAFAGKSGTKIVKFAPKEKKDEPKPTKKEEPAAAKDD